MEGSWKTALKKKAQNANLLVDVTRDVENVLKTLGKNLRPRFQNYTYNNGKQRELFVLDGTIPVIIRGTSYNIPVCILLQEGHPYVAPLVYVRPTSLMSIAPSRHVDTSGKVYHPYLHGWNYKTSDIATLVQLLCSVFSEFPPVYAKSTAQAVNSGQRVIQPKSKAGTASTKQQDTQPDCIICMESKSNSVLLPCGHLGVCIECAMRCKTTTKVCPVCRQDIHDVRRVYQP